MIEQVSIYLTAMILGIMLFFSFVIAPVVFTTLDEDNARKFIRRIFPFYYNVNLAISFIVLLLFLFLSKFGLDFYLILLITILFAISNYLLMPLINKYRDEKQDKKFLRETFGTYIAPKVLDKMYEEKQAPKLGGVEGHHTAFFSDIQDFSTFSEVLEPERMVALMN